MERGIFTLHWRQEKRVTIPQCLERVMKKNKFSIAKILPGSLFNRQLQLSTSWRDCVFIFSFEFVYFFFFGCITYKKHLTLCLVHCKSSVLLFIFSIQHNTTCITHAPLWTPSNPGKRAFLTLKYISHLFLEVKNWLKGKKKLCLSSVSLFHPPWRKGKFL